MLPWLRAVYTSAFDAERKASNKKAGVGAIALSVRTLPDVLRAANMSISREQAAFYLSEVWEQNGRANKDKAGGAMSPPTAAMASTSNLRGGAVPSGSGGEMGIMQMASLLAARVSFAEFQQIMSRVLLDERIGAIYRPYAAEARRLVRTTGGGRMTLAEWLSFQRERQKVTSEAMLAEQERAFLTVSGDAEQRFGLTQLQFQWMLLHEESNTVVDRQRLALKEGELDRPLAHYFVSCSHNTFLDGHQLWSTSTPDMYRRVMCEGCRSVEIDVWDNKVDGEPDVNHGHTNCTPTKFRLVLQALKETAFEMSELPVFISLEMHCHATQQVKRLTSPVNLHLEFPTDSPIEVPLTSPRSPSELPSDLPSITAQVRLQHPRDLRRRAAAPRGGARHDGGRRHALAAHAPPPLPN